MTSFLRSCSECSAHITTNNGTSEYVRCSKCQSKRPSFDQWAETVVKGSTVYVQPIIAGAFSRSRWLVIERDADNVTVQVLGLPQTRTVTTIGQLADEDVTHRPRYAL